MELPKLRSVGGQLSLIGGIRLIAPEFTKAYLTYIGGSSTLTVGDQTYDQHSNLRIGRFYSQDSRGAILKSEKDSVILLSRDKADPSTEIHEYMHEFEDVLTEQERKDVLEWTKHDTWTEKTSELFAKGGEMYLYQGKTFNAAMTGIFDKFKKWLHDIFSSEYFADVPTFTPAMRKLYDTIMSDPELAGIEVVEPVSDLEIDELESLGFINRVC